MTLRVDPGSLTRYGGQVFRAAGDARAGNDHLAKYGHADDSGGGLFNQLFDAHQRAVTAVEGVLDRIATVAEAGQTGLDQAARYYQSTDATAAASFDATLPLSPCLTGSTLEAKVDGLACPPPPFADWRHPRDHLEEPDVPEEPGGFASNPLAFLETLSVSGMLMYALKEVFGFDPIEALVSQLLGDWEKLYECGVVMHNLAELCGDIAVNVDQGARDLDSVWNGNAGDAAVLYFKRFADSIDGLTGPLGKLRDYHQQAAQAAWQAAEGVKAWISALIDEAIVAAALMAAGSALIETGVGTLVCYGGAALVIAAMYEDYEAAMKVIHACYNTILLLVGLVGDVISQIEGLPRMDVVTGTYHPAVAK